jgi:hypothetical protein
LRTSLDHGQQPILVTILQVFGGYSSNKKKDNSPAAKVYKHPDAGKFLDQSQTVLLQ